MRIIDTMRALLVMCLACAACRNPAAPTSPQQPECPTAPQPERKCEACPAPPPAVALACDEADPEAVTTKGDEKLTLVKGKFADLPGWNDDALSEALPAFLASCAQLATLADSDPVGSGPYGGTAKAWRKACKAAAAVPAGDDGAARAMFEQEFTAYAAHGGAGTTGKMTGYYVQPLRGSRTSQGDYIFPLFSRPADLVEVQLSDFISDGRSRRIWGQVDPANGTLVPYSTRAEIRARGLDDRSVLLWVDSPVDAMAVQIEGSGKVAMDDGSIIWINFDGKNGRRGRRAGAVMRAMRELEASNQKIKKPTATSRKAYADRFHEIAELRDSIVFFAIEPRNGAIGTQDVVLTPRRSLAVDRAVIPLSTPVWIDTNAPTAAGGKRGPWRHLLIAQDTGGILKIKWLRE